MSTSKAAIEGVDWTQLLADPDLVRNIAELLKTYRDASAEHRDEALVAAMRAIKQKARANNSGSEISAGTLPPRPKPASGVPPFEPNLFTSNWAQDRRKHPRIRCFVAVELRVNGSDAPIWGNLANTSFGGCQVETTGRIPSDVPVEIGLWLASGKVWVKGMAINGVVTHSAPAAGVRIRFAAMNAGEKQSLREFLKYVQETTKAATSENSYLDLLKR